MLPLLYFGPKAYTAGVAANAAAKDIYEQTAQGKMAGDAVLSGLGTAGLAVAGGKISDIKTPGGKVTVKRIYDAFKVHGDGAGKLILSAGFEATREGVLYLMDFLADKAWRDPDAEFDFGEVVRSAIANKVSGFVADEDKGKAIQKEIDKFWDTLG